MVQINPTDIVGKVFGIHLVLEYEGTKTIITKKAKQEKLHIYKTECIVCGKVTTGRIRGVITNSVAKACQSCAMGHAGAFIDKEKLFQKILPEAKENLRKKKVPNKNNVSTGVKRYCISYIKKRKSYHHTVSCIVDGKRYIFANKTNGGKEPIESFIFIANNLNKVLSKGKEYFYQCLKEGKINEK